MRAGINDNIPVGDGRVFRASAEALFVPVAAVLAAYVVACLALVLAGHGEGVLIRFLLVSAGVATPFLLAQAVLRHVTIRVQPTRHALNIHTGFPSARTEALAWNEIREVTVRRPPLGFPADAGTLRITLAGGRRVAVADLAGADAAKEAILAMAFPEEAELVAEMRGEPLDAPVPLKRSIPG